MRIGLLFLSLIFINPLVFRAQTTVNFNFTGSAQSWTVPPCVTSINVIARGAKGGGSSGGNGAIITATIPVTPGQVLQVNVGGMGSCGNNSQGWNGGGTGRAANSTANASCGGGGATDIRVAPNGLANRLIVAGGGGGTGGGTQDAVGGNGGCPNGQNGTSPFGQGGSGGTTTNGGTGGPPWIASGSAGSAGALGVGGAGAIDPCYNNSPGGGGGGGLFGGGGGGSDCFSSAPYGGGSGGGGSSLVPTGGSCSTGASGNPTNGSLTITYTVGTGTAIASNTGPYCVGQTIQLNVGAANTYSWTGPGGFTSSIQNPTIANASTLNSGVYSVTTVASGCTSTATTTVVVNPLPTVSAGNDQTVCAGGTVTLSGSGANTYTWNNGITNGVAFTAPSNTTTYTVSGTSSNGCVNTDDVIVTVNPLPIVNAGQDVSICSNGTTTLTANGADTYTWNPGSLSGASINVSPSTTTTYTVTGTLLGCVSSDDVVVTVLPNPTVNAGQDVAICIGSNTMLTASGANSYSWDNSLGSGNGFTVSPNVTTTYNVTGTDVNGCIGTDAVLITVNPLPNVSAGSDQQLCEGSSVVLNGGGASTYTWSNNVVNGVAFSQAIGVVTYTVSGTDVNGCVNSDDVQVNVIANPTPQITGPTEYCSANPPVLSTTQSYSQYSWSTGGTNPSVTVTSSDNPITLTVTTIEGCQGTSSVFQVTEFAAYNTSSTVIICQGQTALIHGQLESVSGTYVGNYATALGCDSISTVTLNVLSLPIVSAGSDVTQCVGGTVTLTASGAQSYNWSGNVQNNVSFTPNIGTTQYIVSGTDANGCVSTDQVSVTITPLPQINAGADQQVCQGQAVTLSAQGGVSYSWSNSISDGVAFVPNSSGIYNVTGTDVNGCVNSDQVNVLVNSLPNVFAGNDQTICEGSSITLSGSGASAYTWTGGILNGVQFTPLVGQNVYTLTGTSLDGCTNSDDVIITVTQGPDATFIADENLGCAPHTFNLTSTNPGSMDCVWSSTSGENALGCGTVQMTIENGGCFDITLTATSVDGCVSTFTAFDFICVEEAPDASINALPGSVSSMEPSVYFENNTIGGAAYLWDFGDNSTGSTEFQPSHTYPVDLPQGYSVMMIAFSPLGCSDTAYTSVQVLEELIFYIPNSFTPDGDIFNQTFQPVFTSGFDPFDFNMLIYNRWGEVVFETNDAKIGWDGTYGIHQNAGYIQDGIYTWRIEFKVKNNDSRKTFTGHVNLLR